MGDNEFSSFCAFKVCRKDKASGGGAAFSKRGFLWSNVVDSPDVSEESLPCCTNGGRVRLSVPVLICRGGGIPESFTGGRIVPADTESPVRRAGGRRALAVPLVIDPEAETEEETDATVTFNECSWIIV